MNHRYNKPRELVDASVKRDWSVARTGGAAMHASISALSDAHISDAHSYGVLTMHIGEYPPTSQVMPEQFGDRVMNGGLKVREWWRVVQILRSIKIN